MNLNDSLNKTSLKHFLHSCCLIVSAKTSIISDIAWMLYLVETFAREAFTTHASHQ